jgi:hypothetical protein
MDQIIIKTPNPKCRLYWCLKEFIQSVMLVFSTGFVKRCPSNLLPGYSPPPPILCVNKYTIHTYTVCKGGGVWGHRRGGVSDR